MGLDPATLAMLSPLLRDLADSHSPRILLALRPQDPVPEWITHIVSLGPNSQVLAQGEKNLVLGKAPNKQLHNLESVSKRSRSPSAPTALTDDPPDRPVLFPKSQIVRRPDEIVIHIDKRESLVAMSGVRVTYGSKTVLGGWKQTVEGKEREGLWWNVRRGERWGIFGENGQKLGASCPRCVDR